MSSTDRPNATDNAEGIALLPNSDQITTNSSEELAQPSFDLSTVDSPTVETPPANPVPRNQTGSIPLIRPLDGDDTEPPPHPVDGEALPNIWIYDGEAYDLTPFIAKHPGGQFFIGRTKNRDITTIVNIFHPNPAKVKKIIQKYSLGKSARPEHIHPKYNAPPFLFRHDFNGWRDTPRYDFRNKDQLLFKIKDRVYESDFQKKVARMDSLFNIVSIAILVMYFVVQWLYLESRQYMPIYLFVLLMSMLRISLAGVGHYLIHRPQVGLNKAIANVFDINYVPLALVVTDGHTLLHHPFTQTEVDIKKNVFTFMLEVPRFYRIPVHTVQKIGHVVTGMFARIVELVFMAVRTGVADMYGSWRLGLPHFIGSFGIHAILLGELIVFSIRGEFIAWLAQFFVTVWISTFMIVASHDFETDLPQPARAPEPNHDNPDADVNTEVAQAPDWAVFQLQNSYDLTMIGNKYIDSFLTAGLGPHRAHHVLPQQKSGFANIISEDIVREEAAKFDVEWLESRNFFTNRLPILMQYYLGTKSRMAQRENYGFFKEHFHPRALKTTFEYMLSGWIGIGSI
jgi:Cytochrome b5-like Heme/Steroid binding domain